MDMNKYQKLTERTAGEFDSKSTELACWSMGIAGEAGETCDYIKKVLFHGHELDVNNVKKEIGDVLWYAARLAAAVGLTLSEVAEANIEKLKKRYPDGFREEDSINRKEDAE